MNHDQYEAFLARVREIGQIDSATQLLDWDAETYMPTKGLAVRAEQIATLTRLSHERMIDPALRDLIEKLDGDSGDEAAETNIREVKRLVLRACRVPPDLVERIARVSTHAKGTWQLARKASNFEHFRPHLEELIELRRQFADAIGYRVERYDALIDEYESGMTAAEISRLFDTLRGPLSEFVRAIADAPRRPDTGILHRNFPKETQRLWSRQMAQVIGFDFESGRIDESAHPFCSGTSPGDVRLTTRYQEDFFSSAMFGTLHEAGHGLYEQGLPDDHLFVPRGQAVSLGIHESQSRLWENFVGRSRPFWERFYPQCQLAFHEALGDVSLDDFYFAVNAVSPSLIRVEADEVTYNLHIILRFELERDLISGKLTARDLPAAWNDKMETLVGVRPDDDANGCLQDIHWSMGGFGYFSTYALGNLYAAQFFAKAQQDMPDLMEQIGRASTSISTVNTFARPNSCSGSPAARCRSNHSSTTSATNSYRSMVWMDDGVETDFSAEIRRASLRRGRP
jgi:carboxypeptidase Taq